jgi:putative ABC transport system permease protein
MKRREDVLDEEVAHHLDLLTAEYQSRGLSPDEARAAARRAFGAVAPMKERYRDLHRLSWLADVGRDVRYGMRMLVKDRWVTLTAAIALALGIAATNTVFTIVSTILFRDLPFADPDRIVAIGMSIGGSPRPNAGVSYPDLEDWRGAARSFDGLGAVLESTMNIADERGAAERLDGAFISANAFALIGERPIAGRSFVAADDRAGAPPVVVLGETTWRNRYAGDAGVIGRTVRVNGVPATVIGVMREGFGFPIRSRVWQPLSLLPATARTGRNARGLIGFGRLAQGVAIDAAETELRAVAGALATRYPVTNRGFEPRLGPYREIAIGGRARTTLPLLVGIVVAVLLIACANVANLQLARAASRARELSMRLAVGASRSRIVRQLLVESVLLAVLSGLAGLWLSLAGVRLFWDGLASGGVSLPYWLGFAFDWRAFAFFAVICLGTGILFGLVPALQASTPSITGVLKAAASQSTATARSRWANRFVVAQLALAPMLLTAAGLMLRSVDAQQEIDAGVATAGLVRMRVELVGPRYAEAGDRARFYQQLQDRLEALPLPATIASQAPFEGADGRRLASPAGGEGTPPIVPIVMVGAGYFETLGARSVRGRTFAVSDGAGTAIPVIVNERFVARYLDGADAIGRPIALFRPGPPGAGTDTYTIVGVAPDIRQRSTEDAGAVDPIVYLPYPANPLPRASIFGRTGDAPATAAATVREQLRQIDPDVALFDVALLDESLAGSDERLGLLIFGAMVSAFAVIGLFLATIGVYAVTAYAAAQRTRELGLRIALGATGTHVWWLVTGRAARQLLVGLSLGILGALAVGQILRGILIGTSASDPVTLVGVVALLTLAALAASFPPARRAVRLDPVATLRSE